MTDGGFGRAAVVAAVWFMSASCHPGFSLAQGAASQAAGETPVDFDIPAQPLAAALNAWALQANAQVFVDPGPVAHLSAPAVKGRLAPRQALRALLVHSKLLVVRGSDGVFVIKPRPVVAAAPRPAAPAPVTEVAPEAPAPAAPLSARLSEGPWQLQLDAELVSGNGAVSAGGTAALGGEYFFADHVAGAVAVTLPRTYSLGMPGSARLQSSTVTLKYYFTPENHLRLYLGAGIDVAVLYAATVPGVEPASVGAVIQAGLDMRLNAHWMLNADLGWAQVRPALARHPGQDLRIDPVQFGLGVLYRF